MESPRAIIFVNGKLKNPHKVRSLLRSDDYFVAVDGGFRHMKSLNLVPSLLVGDLDSIHPDDLNQLRTLGVEIIAHPAEKDDTDLDIALQAVFSKG